MGVGSALWRSGVGWLVGWLVEQAGRKKKGNGSGGEGRNNSAWARGRDFGIRIT